MKTPNSQERRRLKRRNLSYYLPILDQNTQQVIGHLVDISPIGVMMDSKIPVPTNLIYNIRLDLMENITGKAFLEFTARSKWCRPDAIQPFMYNAGFEIMEISPEDIETIQRIAEKYGAG